MSKLIPLIVCVMCTGCVVEDALEQALADAILANLGTLVTDLVGLVTT